MEDGLDFYFENYEQIQAQEYHNELRDCLTVAGRDVRGLTHYDLVRLYWREHRDLPADLWLPEWRRPVGDAVRRMLPAVPGIKSVDAARAVEVYKHVKGAVVITRGSRFRQRVVGKEDPAYSARFTRRRRDGDEAIP